MISPAYGLMPRPSSTGTWRPLEAEIRPKMPIIASRELREVARFAAAHVVLLAVHFEHSASLAPHLEETNDTKDLELGGGGERVPLVCRATGRRDVREADGRHARHWANAANRGLEVPRETHAIGLQ